MIAIGPGYTIPLVMTDTTKQEIAKKIREIRHNKGLTQVDVAKRAGISTNYYALIEQANVKPSMEIIVDIIKALDVKSSDILGV